MRTPPRAPSPTRARDHAAALLAHGGDGGGEGAGASASACSRSRAIGTGAKARGGGGPCVPPPTRATRGGDARRMAPRMGGPVTRAGGPATRRRPPDEGAEAERCGREGPDALALLMSAAPQAESRGGGGGSTAASSEEFTLAPSARPACDVLGAIRWEASPSTKGSTSQSRSDLLFAGRGDAAPSSAVVAALPLGLGEGGATAAASKVATCAATADDEGNKASTLAAARGGRCLTGDAWRMGGPEMR